MESGSVLVGCGPKDDLTRRRGSKSQTRGMPTVVLGKLCM